MYSGALVSPCPPVLGKLTRNAERVARRAVEQRPFPQPPLQPMRYPVVLMHGFGAVANMKPGGLLHAEAMHLRARGVWAYAPQVNPYDTIDARTTTWMRRLEVVMAETKAEKVNLVAFSQGGLDARCLVEERGWAGHVASIVTVSSPHRGTSLARDVLERPERIRRWAIAAMDFVGRAAYEGAAPQVEAALRELLPGAVTERFPTDRVAEGVYCASYAARAGQGTDVGISPALMLPNRILFGYEGVNDGFVSVESARWARGLGVLDADHGCQVGLRWPGSSFDVLGFYQGVAEHLRSQGL